jgi:transposase-like protein
MPQIQLPLFPVGATPITPSIAVYREENKVVYFNGHLPVFTHQTDDIKAFRLFTSQMIDGGSCKTGDIVKAFGVPSVTVKRALKCFREHGSKGFYLPPKHKSASKLTTEVSKQAQALLDAGHSVPEVGRRLGILPDTLHKAIRAGRLHAGDNTGVKKKTPFPSASKALAANPIA